MIRLYRRACRLGIGLGAFVLLGPPCRAQGPALPADSLSLSQCIRYAWENALPMRRSKLQQRQAEIQHRQSKADMLPSLNASADHSYNYGRTVDPFTNDFTNTQIRTNNFALTSSWTLFNGLSRQNTLRQRALETRAAEKDYQAQRNDLALQVASAYLSVLQSRERVERFESQLENTQAQKERTELFVKQDLRNPTDLLQVQSQEAQDEVQLTNAQNQLLLNKLQLKQAINYAGPQSLKLKPEIDTSVRYEPMPEPETLVAQNTERLPEMKSALYQEEASEKAYQAARGRLYPSVSVNANVTTGYSTQNFQQVGTESVTTTDTVTLNGQPVPLTLENERPIFESPNFSTQLDNNLGQRLSFRLSIPVFNNLNTRTAVQQAQISRQQASLNYEQTKQQLRFDIYEAHTQWRAAWKQYQSAERNLQTQKQLLEQVSLRREQDLASFYDFVEVRNSYNSALTQFLEAKYNYLFREKVLKFYQGEPLVQERP